MTRLLGAPPRRLQRATRLRSRNLSFAIAITVLIASGGCAAFLYLPSLFEEYRRLAFTVASDCLQDPSLNVRVLDQDDLEISIRYDGFDDPECNTYTLVDHDDIGFLSTLTFINSRDDSLPVTRLQPMKTSEGVVHGVHIQRSTIIKELGAVSDNEEYGGFHVRFIVRNGLVRTGFARTALVLFPAIGARDNSVDFGRNIDLSVQIPDDFVFSSSWPQSPTRFGVLPDGASSLDIPYKPSQAGLVVYFESARAAAIEQLALFLLSSLFGFAVAFTIEEWMKRADRSA